MRDDRTIERLRAHYDVERSLAEQLRNASRDQRTSLYPALYNELFARVPDHPQLTEKTSAEATAASTRRKLNLLQRYLRPDTTFLEIGAGDCALAIEVARRVKQVIAIDVSDEITRGLSPPPDNFTLTISDGRSIPVPAGSVTVAYSNQLMEHLHPDDAVEQLTNIHTALAPGGVYICITPNRLSGPHDISKYFDSIARGFHMKEYTNSDLSRLFRRAGFSKVEVLVGAKGTYVRTLGAPMRALEGVLDAVSSVVGVSLGKTLPGRMVLGARVVGTK
jgi:SAM-dependent methyltransferase